MLLHRRRFAVFILAVVSVFLPKVPCTQAQTGSATINSISYFEVQEANTVVSWSQTSTSVDPATGNSIVNFQDGNGGTSTMVWLGYSNAAGGGNVGATATLSSWTLTPSSGSPQVYADGVSQGQLGSFVLTSGVVGTDQIVTINGQPYVMNDTILQPAQGSGPLLSSFTFGGLTYTGVSFGQDYAGRDIDLFTSGTSTATTVELQGPIYFSNGTCANYVVDNTLATYTYQNGSTAPNRLTQLNGCPLVVSGNVASLPIPQSFVWNGTTFNLSSTWYNQGWLNAVGVAFSLNYTGSSGIRGEIDCTGPMPDLAFSDGQGNTVDIQPNGSINSNPGGFQVYQVMWSSGTSQFTAFNGVPYVTIGSLLVPQGPVSSFTYGGNTYQLTTYSQASDGNPVAQFQTTGANPQTAMLEYSPTTGSMVKLSVNTPSGTATYVDGASVGQPGAYVWSNSSTAPNLLTNVNNNSYTPSGNSDLPGTAQTTDGVFQIKGNFMSLGSWFGNPNQAGMSLSYYDGQTAAPSSIEFTASQPATTWVWDAASTDGTLVNTVMQIDETSRLLLYPKADPQATSATAPSPTVVLDPNPGGVSRFDGPVRIAPQGDLQMGEFTVEPTPAP